MRKKYKKRSSRKTGGGFKPVIILFMIFSLCLLMVWKANKVKDYYARTKNLEDVKSRLISENSGLRASLMDIKSLSAVGKIVTRRFGLTQKVSGRLQVKDPVVPSRVEDRTDFVNMDVVADAIEDAVFRAGKVTAEEQKKSKDNPR